MKNLLLVLTVTLFSFGGNAQELIKEYSAVLLELEQGVSSKEFSKAWKKQKGDWEKGCNNATTVKDVSSLAVEFISKVYEVKMLKAMIITTDNLQDQCIALSNVYNILKPNDLAKWDDVKHKSWNNELNSLTEKVKTAQQKEDAKNRAEYIKTAMADFKTVFVAVLEDSKKGSFANTLEGSKANNEFKVKVKFKAGENHKIVVDGDNIYEYEVEFNTKGDVLLATGLQEAMLKVIEGNVPEGFAKSAKYDKSFVKNEGYRFEFKAEKFALTAKQSSVLIGAKKDGSAVVLKITEPVFKR